MCVCVARGGYSSEAQRDFFFGGGVAKSTEQSHSPSMLSLWVGEEGDRQTKGNLTFSVKPESARVKFPTPGQ